MLWSICKTWGRMHMPLKTLGTKIFCFAPFGYVLELQTMLKISSRHVLLLKKWHMNISTLEWIALCESYAHEKLTIWVAAVAMKYMYSLALRTCFGGISINLWHHRLSQEWNWSFSKDFWTQEMSLWIAAMAIWHFCFGFTTELHAHASPTISWDTIERHRWESWCVGSTWTSLKHNLSQMNKETTHTFWTMFQSLPNHNGKIISNACVELLFVYHNLYAICVLGFVLCDVRQCRRTLHQRIQEDKKWYNMRVIYEMNNLLMTLCPVGTRPLTLWTYTLFTPARQ